VYGKCSNPHGHGHNYVVEVTFAGPVDAETGMVCDLGELDAFTRTNLLARFDHMNLNTLPEFRDRVPTTENFTVEIARIFAQFRGAESGGAQMTRVRVEETGNNSFEYAIAPKKG
jgi:6-pyruvoyltetrahydropterin/6-carboxytetrahydropterin synthase